jgi:hypothetical protein
MCYFKWDNQFNNYHPDITDETFQIEGYHQIRYQTKTYDEQVNKLSVFCQQERQFLGCYLWFCQEPNCKSIELLSAMEDNQAQEEAAKVLQNF